MIVVLVDSDYNFLAVPLIFFQRKKEKYYPQVFLKESKDIEKEKNLIRHINKDLEIS